MKDYLSFLCQHSFSVLCRRSEDDVASNAHELRTTMPESSACLLAARYCVSHSWRPGADEDLSKDLNRHCARTYANEPMQEINVELPLVPLAPSFASVSAQVANLKEELTHGIRLREALKHGLQRSPGTRPKFLGYVPTKTRELLFEVAVLEEEIILLEKHALSLRKELQDEFLPGLFTSFRPNSGEETIFASKKPTALETESLEFGAFEPPSNSEPTTPALTMTPSVTPFESPEWGPSTSSSPSLMVDGSMQLSSSAPTALSLPLSMNSSPFHGDEPYGVPSQLNGNKLVERNPSSSMSLPADFGDRCDVVGKPSKKKPTHKKSASLSSNARNTDTDPDANSVQPAPLLEEVDKGDVFQRLSTPKNGGRARPKARASFLPSPPTNPANPGNSALRRSASMKHVKSKSPTPGTQVTEKVNNGPKKPRRKDLHGRSPSLVSPKLEAKGSSYFKHSVSNRRTQVECLSASTPPAVIEDKAMAIIKCTVSSMNIPGSSQSKFHNRSNSPLTPTAQKGCQDRSVVPFKLPLTAEKETVRLLTLSDEQRRAHDLVITRSLPPIKLVKASEKTPVTPFKDGDQHGLIWGNNFSENAISYAKEKLSSKSFEEGSKVKPVQAQKPSCYRGESNQSSTPKFEMSQSSNCWPERDTVDYDDKDDKVDMVCGLISDAAWVSEDLARLFGSVCYKIRKHSSSSDSATTKIVVKSPSPLLGSSRKVFPCGKSYVGDIKSQGALQLLQEYCSDERDCSEDADKNKSDSHGRCKHGSLGIGPHRHYYKSLKLPFEQKLKA
ncbi:uncharacterized protein [Physcomitrium patens]|uniref:uncharacterized protein isoform X3 n=1 Tax=Physcomitrium patens TaxID=3218 RepID=UPI003CCDAAA6